MTYCAIAPRTMPNARTCHHRRWDTQENAKTLTFGELHAAAQRCAAESSTRRNSRQAVSH